jgi:hypothetical protein
MDRLIERYTQYLFQKWIQILIFHTQNGWQSYSPFYTKKISWMAFNSTVWNIIGYLKILDLPLKE